MRKHPDNTVYNEFAAEILIPRDRDPGIASLQAKAEVIRLTQKWKALYNDNLGTD